MVDLIITPEIDARIRAQVEIWRKQAHLPEKDKINKVNLPFITISRQFGCQAYSLAQAIRNRLNQAENPQDFEIYDRLLLDMICEQEDITTNLVNSLSANTRGEIEDWILGLLGKVPGEFHTFKQLARTVKAIAAKGNAIIIGRGGSVICQEMKTGIHIRIVASPQWRLENLKRHPKWNNDLNMKTLLQVDKQREGFVNKYLNHNINETDLYHLIFNNEKLSISTQAEMVTEILDNRQKKREQNFQ